MEILPMQLSSIAKNVNAREVANIMENDMEQRHFSAALQMQQNHLINELTNHVSIIPWRKLHFVFVFNYFYIPGCLFCKMHKLERK